VTVSRTQAILFGVAGLIVAIVFFLAGKQCSGPGPAVVVVEGHGIDAGPGERAIEEQLDAALQAGVLRIDQVEDKFEEDIAAFDAEQRAEYERLRGGGDLDATARYLSEWNRRRRDGGR
jgi:hypothetical protein